MFAVVRNASKSTYLQAVAKDANNIHVVEGDVGDYASLQVGITPSFICPPGLLITPCCHSQKAAERVSEVTGGKLDYLIHNAARVEAENLSKGFDD